MALCLLALASALPARAAVSATREGNTITMQNNLVKLAVNLEKGARVSEFVYQPFGGNIVYPLESSGGLLMDHVWEQTWPGEFLYRAYEAEIIKNGPDEAVVKVQTVGTGDTVRGVRIERVITLKEGDRAVSCEVTLHNTAEEGRVTGYWNQNNYWFGGKKEGITWARPAVRGIDRLGMDNDGKDWFGGAWYYIDDATAGWNGGFNRDLKQGMMFLMDYNDLWRIYDNIQAVTTEWMYDRVAIPAGKKWTTRITIIPVAGVTGFTHGSVHAVANLEVQETPDALTIEHQVAKGVVPLKDVKLVTKLTGLKKPWSVTLPEVNLPELTDRARSTTVKTSEVGAMPLGIEVTLTGVTADGQTVTETYGDYYGGAEGKNNDPFTMKPYLAFERPPKKKVYLKPDVIAYRPNPEPRVLYLRGLWTSFFRIDEAVKAAYPQAKVTDGWLDASPVGLAFTYFPADYPSLLANDLIVLGNVPAAPLDLVGQEMLKDYLEAGGNVLILGGDQAFGQAEFANERLIELIPLELGGKYNWRKIAGGGLLRATASHAVTRAVKFGARDMVFYSHLCTPKPNATVVVQAGEKPILVLGTMPKGGRIACVLATPFGEASRGQTAFWDSPGWNTLMANTIRWLVDHPQP